MSFPSNRLGFSLVETAIALGLVSFAVVTVIALLPVGFTSLRAAMDDTVSAQIAQKLSGEILLTPYQDLADYAASGPRYFDVAGRPVDEPGEARFEARMLLGPVDFPGAGQQPQPSSDLRCVRISVVWPPAPAPPAATNRWVIFVANSGF